MTIIFYLFSVLLIICAICVITAHNPVQAVFFLIFACFNTSVLWMLLQAEFLSIALILIYVGAIIVLFIFVVMMMDIKIQKIYFKYKYSLLSAFIISFLTIIQLTFILWSEYNNFIQPMKNFTSISNTHEIGILMFTHYMFAFEIAGLILFVAIIAIAGLTVHHKKNIKHKNTLLN